MISDEAVEAAARKLFQSTMDEPWEAAYPAQEDHFRDRARGILEAAAPYIAAQAWEEGEDAGRNNEAADQWNDIEHKSNPYRSQA